MLSLETNLHQALLRYPSIWLGLSGGVDSVVLLELIAAYPELKPRLKVIHIHHGLSCHADAWALFCEQLCQSKDIPFVCEKVNLDSSQNLEARARYARYAGFIKHIKAGEALCLAHHLDDDIETFFLQALRGTGIKGLAGIDAIRDENGITIVRPLLAISRHEILMYAQQKQLSWVEDESNQNIDIFRNYLRQEILPQIEKKWPNYRQALQHTMNSCHEIALNLEPEITFDFKLSISDYADNTPFEWKQILRSWLKYHCKAYPSQKILTQILSQMIYPKRSDNEAIIQIGEFRLIAYRQVLYFFKHQELPQDVVWDNYPKPINIKNYGVLNLSEKLISELAIQEGDKVEIRFRHGGEKIQNSNQTLHHSLKKRFQAWGIPPYQRQRTPLLYVNDVLKQIIINIQQ